MRTSYEGEIQRVKWWRREWSTLVWVLLVVAIVLVWGVVALNPAWVGGFFLERESIQELLVHLSHFGSWYGVVAALFAGVAAILLASNLRLQQRELAAMRKEMDRDRSLQEFIFLIHEFDSAKLIATHAYSMLNIFRTDGDFFENAEMPGHRYIFEQATNYLERRVGGDYCPPEDIDAFRAVHNEADDPNNGYSYDPLCPFLTCAKQIAKFLSLRDPIDRARYMPLFESSANIFDLVVLHEHILISGDEEFRTFAEQASLFAKLKLERPEVLTGGPVLADSAYQSAAAVPPQ